jgi:ABC-2 type transport system ATP-binding protein
MRDGEQGLDCEELLRLEHLEIRSRYFSLDALDLVVTRGARVGLVGRNGSGKTSLVEALVGLRDARTLRGSIVGIPFRHLNGARTARMRLGYLLQHVNLSSFSTVAEVLDLHRAVYGRGWPELASQLALQELMPLRASNLSRGQRQRMDLYMALAHRPQLVIMDEPLAGLDRGYVELVSEVIRGEPLADSAFIMIGHTGDEFALMDKVAVVHGGRLGALAPVAQLIDEHLGPFRMRLDGASDEDTEAIERHLRTMPNCARVVRNGPLSVLAFGQRSQEEFLKAPPPHLRWLASETGPTGLDDVIRIGPREGVQA